MKQTKINIIVPCYNASLNLNNLTKSLNTQKYDNWQVYFIDDVSSDDTWNKLALLCTNGDKFITIKNNEKKYALKNINDACDLIWEQSNHTEQLIVIVDGDDFLINENTFTLFNKAFNEDALFMWTKHSWDSANQNISEEFPAGINPYQWKWVTSHARAFSLNLFEQVNKDNFKDVYGNWFVRGYDQALSLPLLTLAKDRIKFIQEVTYRYNINSVSMPNRDDGGAQLNSVKFIRSRGFLK